MVGKTVSHYEIIQKLGQGGMGEVFLARDTSLDRKVAVKFLPDDFSRDEERVARFRREARLLASISHPHIAGIHGFEQADGERFIVMELAEGETLEARLARGALPVSAALSVCHQIAEGLEAAHEKAIVHRDLKPANIVLSPEGQVKILDFGLAKAFEPSSGATDMLTAMTREVDATRTGVILGTAPYMSPEQCAGRPVDPRADVWAFGCVLYETLAGTRAFPGSTMTEVMGRVLEREPDWSRLPPAVGENITRLLHRCLQKDVRSRLHSIADARIELEDTLAGRVTAAAPAASQPRRTLVGIGAVGGLVAGLVGAALWVALHGSAVVPPDVVRFSIDLPADQPLRSTWNPQLTFSPDGRTLAYSHSVGDGETTVLRRLGDLEGKPLPDAPGMSVPVFSPDGRYLLLMDPMKASLEKVAISGGAPVHFAGYDMAFRGDWAADGFYYWTSHYFGPIVRTPASGGETVAVTTLDLRAEERTHRHVQVLPGGKAIIFTVSRGGIGSFDDANIDLYTLDTKKRVTLVRGGFSPRYSPSGHIVYARGGSLYAVAFDPARGDPPSPPIKLLDGVFMSTNSGAADFDISSRGALAYAAGKAEGGKRTLVWVDRDGKATPLPLPARSYLFPRIAPDGRRIAYEIEGVNHDLYIYDPERDLATKMTLDGVSHAPVWSPDGRHLAFRSWKAGTMTMWWMPSDGSGAEERLTKVGARQSVVGFSPNGEYLAFNQMEPMPSEADGMGAMGGGGPMRSGGTGIWILPMRGDRTPQRFAASKAVQGSGRFSPDGKWVAYCADEGEGNQVFVQAWPGPGPKIRISGAEGGTDPVWSPKGDELFYRHGDQMMVVAVSTQPTFTPSRPRVLWVGHYAHGMSSSCGPPGTSEGNYDISPDGRRFLMIKDADEDDVSTRIVVVLNFAEELKALFEAKQ